MNKQPPLQWLRSFVVAARLLSFTHAAAELSLTQAAISKHIKGLEAWLGVQLFIRQAHGLKLTEQGMSYHLSSAPLLSQLDQLTQQFSTRHQNSRLRLRSNISYSTLVLPAKLALLQQVLPGAAVDINNGIYDPGHPSENAHIEISYASRSSLALGDSMKMLSDDQLFPVVAAYIKTQQLATLPLLQVIGYSGEWRWWLSQQKPNSRSKRYNEWLREQQQHGSPPLRSDNSLTTFQLCAQGLGVALGRSLLVQPLLDNGHLKRLPTAKSLPAPEVFYARLTELGAKHPAATQLFALL